MIRIDQDLGIDYQDTPPWRSYYVESRGKTKGELLENLTISEITQDGEELDTYGLTHAGKEVALAACNLIDEVYAKATAET